MTKRRSPAVSQPPPPPGEVSDRAPRGATDGYLILFEYGSRATSWTYLVPRLAAAGYPALTALNCAQVQRGAPAYMSPEQLVGLAAAGWDLAVNTLDGTPISQECYGWTYDELLAWLAEARAYLASLGAPGDVLAPKEGLYYDSWLAGRDVFAYLCWTNREYSRWPQDARWTVAWQPISDSQDWATKVKPAIDALAGNPNRITCLQVTVIVEEGAAGDETSVARLEQVIAYLQSQNANVVTVTTLPYPADAAAAGGSLALLGAGR